MANNDIDAELRVCIIALLETINDKDDTVNDAVYKSLCKIGSGGKANEVLTTCCSFRKSRKKFDNEHLANIFHVMEQVCMQQGESLSKDTVKSTTDIIINDMISNADYIPSVQMTASAILVAIGNFYPVEVIEPLLLLLKPGVIPHFTIPHTLGSLSATNINGTVPYIKPILAKMLPTLGMLKADPLKQAFSYALGHFSTALFDYFENNDKMESSLEKENFSTEIAIAFDVLYIHWVHSSEPKVAENVLEAMGHMFNLLPIEKIKELIPKLIPTILALYRKSSMESYFVTQSLTLILRESIKQENLLTVPLIEMIIQAMFQLILTSPDYDKPQKIKNHFELLRCFDIIVKNFPDGPLEYIFQQTKNNNEEDRIKAIIILTHLITSSEASTNKIADRFIVVLKSMIVVEHSIKMKKILLKAVVALSYSQHLKNKDDAIMLDFIIKQCNHSNNHSNQIEKRDISDLINDCENSLYLLSSTVTNIKPYLWPMLLKALLTSDNNKTISIICKCLTHLMKGDVNKQNTVSDTKDTMATSDESIYVRCLSLLINHADNKMVHNVLVFLQMYCEKIHKDLKVSWELDLQRLMSFLDSKEFCEKAWESMILDLFRSAIYLVNETAWIEDVLHKILDQIPHSEKNIPQKGILYKFLAILLCHVKDAKSIGFKLDVLFNALHNSSPEESKHIGRALGIASIEHGMVIVEKLDALSKDTDSRKSNKFLNFNFIKSSKHENDINNIRYSITLCYGEVAKEVLDEKVLSRLVVTDTERSGGSIRWAATQLRMSSHTPILIISALNTVHFLAKAVANVTTGNIVLQDRWNLLNLVLDQMYDHSPGNSNIELYSPVIKAIMSLIQLPKQLGPEERNVVLRTLCGKVFNSVRYLKTTFETAEEEKENDIFAKAMNDSLCSLNALIKEFMIQSTCPSTLDDILSILDEWISNENQEIRTAAMRSVQVTLICFIQNIKLTYENPSRFGQTGLIMGKMVPRCSDKSTLVRYIAVDCLKIMIQIVELYEGRTIDADCDIMRRLTEIQVDITTDNQEKFMGLVTRLADIISDKVPYQQTIQLIESLLGGMQGDEVSANGCNIVLKVLMQTKGQDLYQNINDVMAYILNSLRVVQGCVHDGILDTLLTLANHHPKAVVTFLLVQPLPFERSVEDCWCALAHDSSIAKITIEQLMQLLTTEPLFEESLKYDSGKVVAVQSLAAISALCNMFAQPNVQKICLEKFSDLFAMLYTMLACFIGASPPAHSTSTGQRSEKYGFVPNIQATKMSPAKISMDALKEFLITTKCEKAAEACSLCTQLDSGEHLNSFLNMVPSLVCVLCEEYPHHLSKIILSLNQYARVAVMSQRIAVAAFFSHLVTLRCNENAILLESVLGALSTGWRDTALEVRAISLAGLSNIKYLKEEQQEQHLTSVVAALYDGLDDYQGSTPRTNVPLVAIVGLIELLTVGSLGQQSIAAFPPISQRIKSFFNTENPALRESSVRLFGELVSRQKSDALTEQALTLLPCFLLHLADDDANVIRACKQTLRKIAPCFDAQKTNTMIQTHLIDSARLHLVDFTVDLIKNITTELPKFIPQFIENTSNYLNSPWDNIRANAAIIIGILFVNYDKADEDHEKNRKHLTARLLQLLKDPNPRVRACTATAISSLYQHCAIKN